jgi:hypothetical protein
MKQLGIVLALVAVVAFGGRAAAHHSAAQFDFSKSVSLTGVVKKFQAINPHMRLILEVSDAKGTREVEFEGHSTNNMYRAGYRDKMIQVGDKITVYAAPLRDGSEGGYVVAAVTSKGVRFGAATPGEAARERERAEGRAK